MRPINIVVGFAKYYLEVNDQGKQLHDKHEITSFTSLRIHTGLEMINF